MSRWGETGVPRENHLTHPQAELGLSHMWPVQGSNLRSSSFLKKQLRTNIKARMSTNLGLIRPRTAELPAIDLLKNLCIISLAH